MNNTISTNIPPTSDDHGYCATIGFFDGVHRGHQFLISKLTEMAHASGRKSMVITFDRHPRQVVQTDYVPRLITSLDEKLRLLATTDADRVETLHFDAAMAALPARLFMQNVLHDRLGVSLLMTGYDNRFGHNRSEGFEEYVRFGREMGMEVVQAPPLDVSGMRVSSSLVRRLITEKGDVANANLCLGHPFAIEGCVVEGFQEGRKIGFPTANIQPAEPCQLVPRMGLYAARVSIEGGKWHKALLNVGNNPTFCRDHVSLEAHILDFDADIYGKTIRVETDRWMREERRFNSVDDLRLQLEKDREAIINM